MPKQELGELVEMPLRDVFENEPGDFTPWLYENLELLGDAINLDLSPSEREGNVGTLSVDIVAESELGTVVIENQLGRSDHSHLGQLLSYAAGREARFLVWIAPSFEDEHLEALAWLNRWMPEDLEVYGVEVRIVRISDSPPAPMFRALVSPDSPTREAGPLDVPERMSDAESTLRERFFEDLVDEAREGSVNVFERYRASTRSKSFPCGAGDSDLRYWVDLADRQDDGIMVKLYVWTKDPGHSARILDSLDSEAEEIEKELGFEAEYKTPQGRQKAGWVYRQWRASIWDDDDALAEHRRTIVATLKGFQRVLDPRVEKIIEELEAEEAGGVDGGLTGEDIN